VRTAASRGYVPVVLQECDDPKDEDEITVICSRCGSHVLMSRAVKAATGIELGCERHQY